ncbi:MAG: hypothetical protein A2277_20740 [Desulfobacterales bacterium RIFOXYA12_FULL_46_15]|nr:MAG: hypothetical protein A2277_20740 [Desulfobacterales bacterium RIFOXYA12_FULL_46_15]
MLTNNSNLSVSPAKFTECRCPATGELLGYSQINTETEIKAAIEMARIAQKSWAALHLKQRIRFILKIRNYMINNFDELVETITRDNGKTRTDALIAEIFPSLVAISFYCRHAKSYLKERNLPTGHLTLANKRSKIIRVPWGVVAIIAPWNVPFAIPFTEIVTALLAGNAVIFKGATQTQMVGLALKKCIETVGIPPGVFTYINFPGSSAGDVLLESGINKLFYTGSVPSGKYLMRKAAETLTPVMLELGGNDPMLVCEDADPYRAAMGAIWGGYTNAGQSCAGVERVYVHEAVYEPFLAVLKKKVESLRVGYGMDLNIDMGAMTTEKQAKVIQGLIEDALTKGAVVYAQSKIPNDTKSKNFMPATVLTNANHDMRVMREEIFGPVIAVMKVKDMEEAIHLANESNFGLTASVWSRNQNQAEKIARRLEAGTVNINDHMMSHAMPETPWGGFKESSIGRTHGALGFTEMTQPQVIIRDIMPWVKRDLWWAPNNQSTYEAIKGVAVFWYGTGFKKRLKGMIKFLKVSSQIFKRI